MNNSFIALSQESFKIIDKLRKYELDSISLENSELNLASKKMLEWQINFLKSFEVNDAALQIKEPKLDCSQECEIGLFYYFINSGDYLFYKYHSKNVEVKEFYIKALEHSKKSGSIELECEALKRILNLNRQTYLRDNISSLEYLERYKEIAYDNIEVAYQEYYNLILSFQYIKLDRWLPESSKYLLDFAKTSSLNYLNASIYQLHAVYEHTLGNNAKAITYEEKALKELEKIPYGYRSTLWKNSQYALARYHIYNGDSKKAKFYLKNINLKPSNRIEKENQKYYYLYNSILDSIDGDYFSAYSNFRNYNNQNIFNNIQKNQNAFSELEAKYQTAQKEKQILKEQQRATTNRNWLFAAVLALVLGTGIAILLQKNTSKKRKLAEQEVLLKQERVDNLLKEQELVSIDAMIEGQEKERKRVADELHDDLGSLMATIKLHFDNAQISKKDPGLQSAQKLLEEAYQKVRGMAHNKNSGVMSNQGLLPAIKKMADVISSTNTLQVNVEDFGMGDRLENSLELTLFRIVQELVANAIKHSGGNNIGIQLTQHEELLNIIVEDNGKGFDRSKLPKTQTGMGLTNIEKRVEHLEGNFTIDSVPGKGTSIIIDIPV